MGCLLGWGLERCPGLRSCLSPGRAGQVLSWSLLEPFLPAPIPAGALAALPSPGEPGCRWVGEAGRVLGKREGYRAHVPRAAQSQPASAEFLQPFHSAGDCSPGARSPVLPAHAGAAPRSPPLHARTPKCGTGGAGSPRSASGSAIYKRSGPSSAGTRHLPALHHCHPKNHGLETGAGSARAVATVKCCHTAKGAAESSAS